MKINIIVLNYNGIGLLKEYLPSAIEASNKSKYDCSVTVLDNKSTDSSVSFLRKEYSEVRIYIAKENRVLCSYNEFVKTIDDDLVLLLNNDMKFKTNFIDPMVELFLHDKEIAFVTSCGYWLANNRYGGDKAKIKNVWGIITADVYYSGYEFDFKKIGYTFAGGIGMFDRKKFIESGGYDELYLPGRYEDVDLCYRLWKRGWKGVYQPLSVLRHHGGVSFQKNFTKKDVYALVFRNSILFMIKNITDPLILFQFIILLPVRLLYYFIIGKWFLIKGFFNALKRLPLALEKRKKSIPLMKLSDRQVFYRVNCEKYVYGKM